MRNVQDDIARMDADFVSAFNEEAVQIFDPTGSRDAYGPTPAAEVVDAIRQRAEKCENDGFDEVAWMCLVHSPLMLLALENDMWKHTVDFIPWYVHDAPQLKSILRRGIRQDSLASASHIRVYPIEVN
jgi:hypothetical protein